MKFRKKGFTLIELMIVVAIIGIIAAIAIPNYVKFLVKAKQAEAKSNLGGIFKVEMSYYAENSKFVTEFTGLAWIPVGPYRYCYHIGGAKAGLDLPTSGAGGPRNADTPGAGDVSFTAVAWGNLDGDAAIDTWQITYRNDLSNKYDDVKEENP